MRVPKEHPNSKTDFGMHFGFQNPAKIEEESMKKPCSKKMRNKIEKNMQNKFVLASDREARSFRDSFLRVMPMNQKIFFFTQIQAWNSDIQNFMSAPARAAPERPAKRASCLFPLQCLAALAPLGATRVERKFVLPSSLAFPAKSSRAQTKKQQSTASNKGKKSFHKP